MTSSCSNTCLFVAVSRWLRLVLVLWRFCNVIGGKWHCEYHLVDASWEPVRMATSMCLRQETYCNKIMEVRTGTDWPPFQQELMVPSKHQPLEQQELMPSGYWIWVHLVKKPWVSDARSACQITMNQLALVYNSPDSSWPTGEAPVSAEQEGIEGLEVWSTVSRVKPYDVSISLKSPNKEWPYDASIPLKALNPDWVPEPWKSKRLTNGWFQSVMELHRVISTEGEQYCKEIGVEASKIKITEVEGKGHALRVFHRGIKQHKMIGFYPQVKGELSEEKVVGECMEIMSGILIAFNSKSRVQSFASNPSTQGLHFHVTVM